MVDLLWYDDLAEVVDNNWSEESEIIDAIELSIDDETALAENSLESLSRAQLTAFLTAECFPDWAPKNYSQIKQLPYINFSIRAALQMMWDINTGIYTIDGNVSAATATESDANNKTIDEWLISRWWITNEYNSGMTKFLQKMVGAHPDGFTWPQTIYKIIENLSGAVNNNLAEWVNTLYKGKEKFQVMKIGEYTSAWVTYKYNEDKIKSWDGKKWTFNIEFNGEWVLITEWLKVENGWIVLDDNETGENNKENEVVLSRLNINLIDSLWLESIWNGIYQKTNIDGFYTFGEDNILYFSGEGVKNQKFIWPKSDNWKNIENVPKKLIEHRLIFKFSLNKLQDGIYKIDNYPGVFCFTDDWVLYYTGPDLWLEKYNLETNKWISVSSWPEKLISFSKSKEYLINMFKLIDNNNGLYTRDWHDGKYVFDNNILYYAWTDSWYKKFIWPKANQWVDELNIPEIIKFT